VLAADIQVAAVSAPGHPRPNDLPQLQRERNVRGRRLAPSPLLLHSLADFGFRDTQERQGTGCVGSAHYRKRKEQMIRIDQAAAILTRHILGNHNDGLSSGIETL
jgi:hypothetical protein